MSSKNEYEGRPVLWVIGGGALVVSVVWFFLTGALVQFAITGVAMWVGFMATKPPPETKSRGKK